MKWSFWRDEILIRPEPRFFIVITVNNNFRLSNHILAEEIFTKDIIIRGKVLYKRYHVSDTCQMISAKEKNF